MEYKILKVVEIYGKLVDLKMLRNKIYELLSGGVGVVVVKKVEVSVFDKELECVCNFLNMFMLLGGLDVLFVEIINWFVGDFM